MFGSHHLAVGAQIPVAITRTGSSNDLAARIILSAHGLTPGPDVTLIQTNDQLQALAALQSGGVDSAVFSPPTTLTATGAGYPSITDVAATGAVLIDLLTVTSRAYTNTHPEGMLAYLAGYVEGLQEFLGNPESSAAIIASYTQSDADTAREGYRVVLPTIDPRPFIREEGLKTIQRFDLSGRLSSVDLAAAHDDTFLAQLPTAGLLDAGGSVPR